MSDTERSPLPIGNSDGNIIDTCNLGGVIHDPSPNRVLGDRSDTTPDAFRLGHEEKAGSAVLLSPKVRDERLYTTKFWLVVLVITAHVIMRKEFVGSTACFVLWNWLCLFAMPLFVFISGYYSRKKDWQPFWSSIWKVSEPLIIFQTIGLLFYVGTPLTIKTILTPWYMLWYLLSLIFWRLILQMIPDWILKRTKLVLITTFCIGILAGFLPFDKFLSLQRTLALMPFFFLGYSMKGRNLYLPDKYKLLCLVFLIVIFALLFFYPHRINDLKFATPYKSIFGAAIRIMVFALAVPMSVAFINVCYHTPWTARQGRMSLQYYIYHALIIPPNSSSIMPPIIMLAVKLNIPMIFVTAAIIIIGIIVVIAGTLKIPYIKSLTNPSQFFVKRSCNLLTIKMLKSKLKNVVSFSLLRKPRPVYARITCIEPSMKLKGKKVIVTGGGSGLGYAMAKRFVEEGAEVLISGRNRVTLSKSAGEIGCKYLQIDVKDVSSFDSFLGEADNLLGGINCLVNNAGISLHEKSFFDVTEESFRCQVDTNLIGTFFLSQHFAKYLIKKQTAGNILIISSETGITSDIRPYGYTKAALNSMVEGIAYMFAKQDIRINAIAPGITASQMTGKDPNGDISSNKEMLGRVYLPEEVAGIASFLLSDASSCLTGQILVCNNGKTINARVK